MPFSSTRLTVMVKGMTLRSSLCFKDTSHFDCVAFVEGYGFVVALVLKQHTTAAHVPYAATQRHCLIGNQCRFEINGDSRVVTALHAIR